MGTPDFQWGAFYYDQILAALLELKRRSWPEHTETDERDPVVQIYRAFAVLGHLQAARLDHVARELMIPTCRLRSSLIALARLVDYQLARASTAQGDLLADVSGNLAGVTDLVKAHSHFGTVATEADAAAVVFEWRSDDALEVGPTGTWRVFQDDGGVVSELSTPFTPWPGGIANGDALYFLHESAMWDRQAFAFATPGDELAGYVRREYYDDSRIGSPDTVTDNGGTISLEVYTLVGTSRADGLPVTVTCLRTGVSETVSSTWGTANEITTSGTLGQVAVSTSAADYEIQTWWPELPDVDDETATSGPPLELDGVVSWTLPQEDGRRWAKSTVGTVEGYAWRYRFIALGSLPVEPVFTLSGASGATWSIMLEVEQGQRVVDRLGSTDGTAGQAFELPRTDLLELVELAVDGEPWEARIDLLSSSAFDRHFRFREEPDGSWSITFGDGTNGRIPTSSSEVVATYRVGGVNSGNLGAGELTRDRSGNARLRNVRNPRALTGWIAQEATTDAGLELTREAIPASLRALTRAVTPADYEELAVAWRDSDGDQVVERALAVEEGSGLRTVLLYCVGPGGRALTAAELAELETYFNGELVGLQRIGGVSPANVLADAASYTAVPVDVTATVEVLADFVSGAAAAIAASLEAVLQPTAFRQVLGSDGTWEESADWQWTWGQTVSRAVLLARIVTAVSGVVNVTLTTPAADVVLGADELPTPGTISITVTGV